MRFFLYGTLIDAANTPMARWLRPRLLGAATASVAGRLIAIPSPQGWYPALLPAGPGQRVHGTCCELALSRQDLSRLDRYEGAEYRRVTARARGDEGMVAAQLYRWRGPPPTAARPVPGGDFLRWLQENGLRAHAATVSGSEVTAPSGSRRHTRFVFGRNGKCGARSLIHCRVNRVPL
jgi:gamma-glutamylcyclotransferase (GGCT)/AIG2-like uncharacterized protein YtfP